MHCTTRWICLTVVCLSTLWSGPALAGSPDIQRILDERVTSGLAAGLVVGVVRDGQRQFFSAGRLHADRPQSINEHSILEIGSISKVFTTLLLATMIDDGLLKLEDPAQQYLPATVTMPLKDGGPITLEHLATHTSGLPRMPGNFTPKDPQNPYADYTVQQLYAFLSSQGPTTNPQNTSNYSNLGMGLLGHILERRSGTSYEQLMIARITRPLGMATTTTRPRPADAARVASGHQGRTAVSAWDIPTLAGAGDINSTAADMLIFTEANLGLRKTTLFPAMQRCHAERVTSADPQLKVGLGWHIWTKNGSEIIWHNGGTGGFASFLGFRPDTREGVVVLSNSSFRAVDQIGLHLLNPKYELDAVAKEVPIDSSTLQDYVGTYSLPMGQIFSVKIEDDQLQIQLSGQPFFPVFPEGPDAFFYRVVEAKIVFLRTPEGKVDRLVLHQGGMQQAARRMDKPYEPSAVSLPIEQLERLVGEYQFTSGGPTVSITREGAQLKARLSGQPAYEIYPQSATRFFFKIVVAEISFQIDDHNHVQSLTLHQGGRDQVARRAE